MTLNSSKLTAQIGSGGDLSAQIGAAGSLNGQVASGTNGVAQTAQISANGGLSAQIDPSANLNGQITFLSKLLTLLSEETDNQNYLVANFREIVKRDVMLNPTIEAIADQLNLSREHLQREYRNQTGISPAKYLRDRRFEILCSLLMTDLTEKQIVEKMNFAGLQ